MSFDQLETSRDSGEPIELYRFSIGQSGAVSFAYCDSDVAVTVSTTVYEPMFINRQAIVASETLDKADLEVRVPEDSDLAALFLTAPPADVVALTIFRCHWDEAAGQVTSPQTIWVGRVLGCSREGFEAKLTCEPVATSLRRVGLRRHYQYMCPHVLYGAACGAASGSHRIVATPTTFDARSITYPGVLSEQYVGGVVTWQPVGRPVERRTILQRSVSGGSTVFVLAGGVRDLSQGQETELFLGCRHTLEDCRDVFNNAQNYGGMPFIPTQNPHGTTAIYN